MKQPLGTKDWRRFNQRWVGSGWSRLVLFTTYALAPESTYCTESCCNVNTCHLYIFLCNGRAWHHAARAFDSHWFLLLPQTGSCVALGSSVAQMVNDAAMRAFAHSQCWIMKQEMESVCHSWCHSRSGPWGVGRCSFWGAPEGGRQDEERQGAQ